MKLIEDLETAEKELKQSLFGGEESQIPFTYDFEDFNNCKLNIEIKKMLSIMEITLPVVYDLKSKQYFVGTKKHELMLKGQFIHVVIPNTAPANNQ